MALRDVVRSRLTKAKTATPAGKGTPLNVAALTRAFDPQQRSRIPDDIAESMHSQGMDTDRPFAPGSPVTPYFAQGTTPRSFDFTAGRNTTARPRSEEGRVAFETMRKIIAAYPTARICIQHVADDIRSLDRQFVAADGVNDDVTADIEKAKAFFARPDGVTPFDAWQAKLLEDVLRFDAGCIYKQRDRGGRLLSLKVVDGTTVAPLLNYDGSQPEPPAWAYVQFANGVPWGAWSAADIVYMPFRPQPESVYGLAAIESLLIEANTSIRQAMFWLSYYTDGSVPDSIAEAPEDMSQPENVIAFQEAWDAMLAGNDEARSGGVRWVPHGANLTQLKEQVFQPDFALYMDRKTCAAFGVAPQDIGILNDVNRATADTQTDMQFRVLTRPRALYLKGIYDHVLQEELGLRVQFLFDLGQEKEDRLVEAQAWKLYVEMGAASSDEPRKEVLGLPVDESRPVPRFVMTSRGGPVPLNALMAVAGDVDPETVAPAEGAELPTEPFAPIAGVVPNPPPKVGGATIAPDDAAPTDEPQPPDGSPSAPSDEGEKQEPDDEEEPTKPVAKGTKQLVAAGLAVKAADTGRVLMLQRSIADDTDPAAGTWEFPGGHIDAGEQPLHGAIREWEEETGAALPAGVVAGSWISGVYQGFVYVVAHEDDVAINCDTADRHVLNPDDPDGDDIETACWWDLDHVPDMPGLRPEARSTNWQLLADAELPDGAAVAKEATAGMTSATGLTGIDELDDDEDEDEPTVEEIAKELRRWRDNARKRVRKGQAARMFVSDVLPADTVAQVWNLLRTARTVQAVDHTFGIAEATVAKAGRPKASARDWAGHELADRLHDYYVPKLRAAFRKMVDVEHVARQSSELHLSRKVPTVPTVAKAANPEDVADARSYLTDVTNLDPGTAEQVLRDLYGDSYLAGAGAASLVLGGSGAGSGGGGGGAILVGGPGGAGGHIDWDNWEPGNPAAADQLLAAGGRNGLQELLDQADITIKSVADSYMDDLANALALGLENGDSVDTIAADLADILDDESHARMVAVTETARAQTSASLATYRDNGVSMVAWLAEDDACEECLANEDASPIAIDDDWPSGDAPVHPWCRCAVAPAIDENGLVSADESAADDEG